MAKIVIVNSAARQPARFVDMSSIRWLKMAEALVRRGHSVDLATGEFKWKWKKPTVTMAPRLRRVPISLVRWSDYDVVKTLYQWGWDVLGRYGGQGHPFIISRVASVVAPQDREGIYFYGKQRERLYRLQQEISSTARYVSLTTRPALELWRECFGPAENIVLVPGAAAALIPAAGPDPYPSDGRVRCVFSGNFFSQHPRSQPEAHHALVGKLNELGRCLDRLGARLYLVGDGDSAALDRRAVHYIGAVPYDESWNYLYHAHVGLMVAIGAEVHNNESTKMYHYLRAGLPVVSEAGFPNEGVIRDAALGSIVPNGDLEQMARRAVEVAGRSWDRAAAVRYVLANHTWDERAGRYHRLLTRWFGPARATGTAL